MTKIINNPPLKALYIKECGTKTMKIKQLELIYTMNREQRLWTFPNFGFQIPNIS